MKILGFNIGSQPQPMIQTVPLPNSSNGKYNTFSTPFAPVGKGNLSLPRVDKYYTQNGIVRFGEDNLYPQLLDQMYYTSALHGSIIDFTTNDVVGLGFKWDVEVTSGKDKVELIQFERSNRLNKLIEELTRNYIIHRRMLIKVTKKGDKLIFNRIEPSMIRNSYIGDKFAFSPDWSRGMFEVKNYPKYHPTCGDGEYILQYADCTPGQDIYPIPSYNSILNWCYLDGEISFLQKAAIQNSAFPSIIIKRPKDFSSPEEVDTFKSGIQSSTSTENAGKIMVLAGNGIDMVPDVVQLTASTTDKQFEVTSKEIKDQICFAHKINPAIMGIKVAGSLGNSEELKMSYAIFEKNVVNKIRQVIVEFVNELIFMSGISNTVSIINQQIIDGGDTITTKPEELSNDAQSAPKTEINDNLKGLNAQENADMYRIVRDHSKGKLPDALAIARLAGYGLTEEQAKNILDIK